MLDIAAQLVAQAASNSAFVFFFCNLLVIAITMGSKSSSNFGEMSTSSPLPIFAHGSGIVMDREETAESGHSAEPKKAPPTEAVEPRVAENLENVGRKCEDEDEDEEQENEDDDSNNDIDDDELRRRIEEFIGKVNREWKAEKLRDTMCMVRGEFDNPLS